jgi:hypothetical protein
MSVTVHNKVILSQMTKNALSELASELFDWLKEDEDIINRRKKWKAGPPKEMVASMPYWRVKNQPNIGNCGLANIIEWLADDRMQMAYGPKPETYTLVEAINVLRQKGYTVYDNRALVLKALQCQ